MKKCAKGPPLTWILIAAIVGISVIVLSIGSYNQFIADNTIVSSPDDPIYSDYYSNLTDQEGDIIGFGEDISDQNTITRIFEGITGAFNIFVLGLSAIGKFFDLIPILKSFFALAGEAVPGFSALIGLGVLVLVVYMGMRYIQSARGTSTEV